MDFLILEKVTICLVGTGAQIPDIGIWRDISLIGYECGKIDDIYITQHHKGKEVELDIKIKHTNYSNKQLTAKLEIISPDNGIVEKIIVLDSPEVIEFVKIDSPKLWWPNGFGEQPIYDVKVSLIDNEKVIDLNSLKIGLRTLRVKKEIDKWGETFEFEVNGVSIFAMGANYIPEDNILSRCSYERTKKLIVNCIKSNFNCIRVWEAGYILKIIFMIYVMNTD